jgi:hypothetical protein
LVSLPEIYKRTVGARHPDYAECLSGLAILKALKNDPAAGVPLAREALRIAKRHLENTAASQSEGEQLSIRQKVWTFLDADSAKPYG